MDRAETRRNTRMVRKKLTDEQYEDFKKNVVRDAVQDIIIKFSASVGDDLFNTLRNNGIGEDRAKKIIEEFGGKIKDV